MRSTADETLDARCRRARRRRCRRAIGLAVCLVLVAACGGRGNRPAVEAGGDADTSLDTNVDATDAPDVQLAAASVDQASATPAPDASATPSTLAPLTRTLHSGDQGDDVRALQQRLNELHFDVKAPDGFFGPNTSMAIWAYEQLVLGLPRAQVTGTVTPDMWEQMRQGFDLPPRRVDATPTHIEIFLDAQAAAVYEKGALRLITHISSGSGEHWCAQPRNVPAWTGATTTIPANGRLPRVCGDAVTPGGTFKVYRKESGWYDIPLGKVYNPMYFNSGLAIHGYQDVPFRPASHGCVRMPMHIAEYLPDIVHTGDDVLVWDGEAEPETYGSQRPPLDQPDPSDTATRRAPSKPPATTAKTGGSAAPATTRSPAAPVPTAAPAPTKPPAPTTVATPAAPRTTVGAARTTTP